MLKGNEGSASRKFLQQEHVAKRRCYSVDESFGVPSLNIKFSCFDTGLEEDTYVEGLVQPDAGFLR